MEFDHKLLEHARQLRENMTRQERHLWYDFLRTYPAKFRKQQPIGTYIVDFYCHAARLVVELDGGQHYEENAIDYDKRRTAFLSSQGLGVLRFTNTDVDYNFSGVCQEIDRAARALSVGGAASSPKGGPKRGKASPVGGGGTAEAVTEREMFMNHEIIVESELETDTADYEKLLKEVIPAVLKAEQVGVPCEVDVLFTDDEGIQEINLEQREVDKPTDVLSFPMFELTPGVPTTEENAEMDPDTGLLPLGDMVISVERAEAQGAEFGHGPKREMAYLAVHSVLHLLGYDHMDDGPQKKLMRAREEEILNNLGITRE